MADQKKRVTILVDKYPEVGAVFVRWVQDPESRPTNVEELQAQLSGLAEIDTKIIKYVKFVDTPMDTALFRLPPREMVEKTLAWAAGGNTNISGYVLPDYYDIDTSSLNLTPLELFHCRIGDYTTGECR